MKIYFYPYTLDYFLSDNSDTEYSFSKNPFTGKYGYRSNEYSHRPATATRHLAHL